MVLQEAPELFLKVRFEHIWVPVPKQIKIILKPPDNPLRFMPLVSCQEVI